MDVLSDVLRSSQLATLFYGRWELGTPWALHVPSKATSSFYVLARGRARLTRDGAAPVFLSARDVVLLPHGVGHVLDDGSRARAPSPRHASSISSAALVDAPRVGGDGPSSVLAVGCFGFANSEHPLLRALPQHIHLPADDPSRDRGLAAAVDLLVDESAARGPGSELILARVADVLLAQTLRQLRWSEDGPRGWGALADPPVAAALELLHEHFAEPWTVATLASTVGLSRSGLAQRFRARVGASPARYLVGLRMRKAAMWLRDGDSSVEQIAGRVGYISGASFRKAFKRFHGQGPGRYRKGRDAHPRASVSLPLSPSEIGSPPADRSR